VIKSIARRGEELVDLCRLLVEAASENPPGDTRGVAAVVIPFLEGAGVKVDVIASDERAPNLVAQVDGRAPGRHLVLNAHMDTILAGDEREWTVPVHRMTRRDGRLFGLGMGNMKGALAAMCLATAVLAERREAWSGRVTLTAVSDEVVFGERGSAFLLAERPDLLADGFLSGEGPGEMRLGVAEKGIAWVEVEARVQPQQAMVVERGSTAVARLAGVIEEIDALNDIVVEPPADLPEISDDPDMHQLRVSANVGILRAGSVVNQVATPASAHVDIRLPPGVSLKEMEQRIMEIASRHEGVSWRLISGWDANWTSPGSAIPSIVSDSVFVVRGRRPTPAVRLPGSDASRWRRKGIQAVCYGPQPTLAAGVDDYAEEQDVVDCASIYALAAAAFCSGSVVNREVSGPGASPEAE
jgi:succinyl-diaminopimelate desuccinylase